VILAPPKANIGNKYTDVATFPGKREINNTTVRQSMLRLEFQMGGAQRSASTTNKLPKIIEQGIIHR